MKKYSLSLAATAIALSVSLVQCNAPASTDAQVTTKTDSANAKNEAESKKKPIATLIDKPTPIMLANFSLKSVKATIRGTSTLHDWESQITKMESKGSLQSKDDTLSAIKDGEIKIAVRGIKSKEGKKMDNKTYEAFKSDENPYIIYTFSNAIVKINASHVVTIESDGKLSMAGTSNPLSLSASGKELANGDLQLTVSKKIKMTDYNMKPPVMFLGTLKVGDEITVSFDLVLTKQTTETKASL